MRLGTNIFFIVNHVAYISLYPLSCAFLQCLKFYLGHKLKETVFLWASLYLFCYDIDNVLAIYCCLPHLKSQEEQLYQHSPEQLTQAKLPLALIVVLFEQGILLWTI